MNMWPHVHTHTTEKAGSQDGLGAGGGSPALTQVTGDRGFHVSEPQFAAL